MISHTTERFRKAFRRLPSNVQRQGREAYRCFTQNPYHPGLHFKQVHPTKPVYAVRIGIDYRALGVRAEDEIVWFWIGLHPEYERLIARL